MWGLLRPLGRPLRPRAMLWPDKEVCCAAKYNTIARGQLAIERWRWRASERASEGWSPLSSPIGATGPVRGDGRLECRELAWKRTGCHPLPAAPLRLFCRRPQFVWGKIIDSIGAWVGVCAQSGRPFVDWHNNASAGRPTGPRMELPRGPKVDRQRQRPLARFRRSCWPPDWPVGGRQA